MQLKKVTLVTVVTLIMATCAMAAKIPIGIYALGTATASQRTFMMKYFDWISGSSNLFPTADDFTGRTGDILTYHDVAVTDSLSDHLTMYDWALTNSVNPEEMLLHSKKDVYTGLNPTWEYVDKFDGFENANGVIKYTGSYSDLTATAYSSSTTWSNTMYVGYQLPFDQMNLVITTAGVGITKTWEYWNGSAWTTLTVTDGTSNFASSGQISFTPPATWARTIVNGSRSKYFVRCVFTAATTSPVTSSIKGDNWAAVATTWVANSTNGGQYSYTKPTTGGGNIYYNTTGGTSGSTEPTWPTTFNATVVDGTITWKTHTTAWTSRGWDSASGSIVNTGELAYNPTPPAYATAKFRYQARVAGWGRNRHYLNLADFQTMGGTSKRTSVEYFAYITGLKFEELPFTGMMWDDVATYTNMGGITPKETQTDFADKAGSKTSAQVDAERYSELAIRVKADYPTAKLGGNTYEKANVIGNGDFNLYEYMNYTDRTGDNIGTKMATTDSATAMCYDNYASGTQKGFTIYDDALARGTVSADWDNVQRGPMIALSKHLIGWNSNVIFGYVSLGGAYYSERDEVQLKDGSHIHFGELTEAQWPKNAQVKRWGVFFPAMTVDFGTPVSARNMEWAKSSDYGWSCVPGSGTYSNNVWSREWTNALVLHRPNGCASYAVDWNTYSVPLNLGGTYYPLNADGTTGAGITSIQLRRAEGAILMKAPIGSTPSSTTVITSKAPGRYISSQTVALTAEGATTIKYCLTAGCTPATTYSTPFKILQNIASQVVRTQADDGTVQEDLFTKQCLFPIECK